MSAEVGAKTRVASLAGTTLLAAAVAVVGMAGTAYAQVEVETPDDFDPTIAHCTPDGDYWDYSLSAVHTFDPPETIDAHLDDGTTLEVSFHELQTSEAFYRIHASEVPSGASPTGSATAVLDIDSPGEWVGRLQVHSGPCAETSVTIVPSATIILEGEEVTLTGQLTRTDDGAALADRPLWVQYRTNEPDCIGKCEVQVLTGTDDQGHFEVTDSDNAPGVLNFEVRTAGFGPFGAGPGDMFEDLPFTAEHTAFATVPVVSLPSQTPDSDGELESSQGTTFEGETVLSGDGFAPGADIAFMVYSTPVMLGSTTADETGAFVADVEIPDDLDGEHVLAAIGSSPTDQLRSLTLSVTLGSDATAAADESGEETLAATGSTLSHVVIVGVVMLATGVAFWVLARRRTRLSA